MGGTFQRGVTAYAMGGAFQRGVTPYAMGGIVNRPTFFAYANGGVPGTGLMGEAGPEAVVPLRRLPNGKLGVGSTGGGTNVTVNVDATGSSVQGDSTQGAALGRAIAAAVQAELINQKRRGNLLNS
jgi:lambda family phage tail tape measure protein